MLLAAVPEWAGYVTKRVNERRDEKRKRKVEKRWEGIGQKEEEESGEDGEE